MYLFLCNLVYHIEYRIFLIKMDMILLYNIFIKIFNNRFLIKNYVFLIIGLLNKIMKNYVFRNIRKM